MDSSKPPCGFPHPVGAAARYCSFRSSRERLVFYAKHSKDPGCFKLATHFSKPLVARLTFTRRVRTAESLTIAKAGTSGLRHGRETPAAAEKRATGGSREGSPQDSGCSVGHLVDRSSLWHTLSPSPPPTPRAGCSADSCNIWEGRSRAHINRWLYSFVPRGFNRLGLRNKKSLPA